MLLLNYHPITYNKIIISKIASTDTAADQELLVPCTVQSRAMPWVVCTQRQEALELPGCSNGKRPNGLFLLSPTQIHILFLIYQHSKKVTIHERHTLFCWYVYQTVQETRHMSDCLGVGGRGQWWK